jgi:hypothetical protein
MASQEALRGDGADYPRVESSDSQRPFNGTSSGQPTLAEHNSHRSRSSSDADAAYVDLNTHGNPIVLTRTRSRSRRGSFASQRSQNQDMELDEQRMATLIRTLSRKQTEDDIARIKSRREPKDPFDYDDPNWDLESFVRAFLARVREAENMPDVSSRVCVFVLLLLLL